MSYQFDNPSSSVDRYFSDDNDKQDLQQNSNWGVAVNAFELQEVNTIQASPTKVLS